MQTDDEINETGNDLDINQKDTLKKDDEISLIDLFAVLLKRKMMIILITVIAAVFIFMYSIISLKQTNIFLNYLNIWIKIQNSFFHYQEKTK